MHMRKRFTLAALVPAALALAAAPLLGAQAPPSPLPPVPTTRILAIGHIVAGADFSKVRPILRNEVPDTVRLYLAGKIDQWYTRKDANGVVFIMNATTVEEAHAILEKLPLGQAHLMDFDLIPLGPLSPLNLLLTSQTPPPPSN